MAPQTDVFKTRETIDGWKKLKQQALRGNKESFDTLLRSMLKYSLDDSMRNQTKIDNVRRFITEEFFTPDASGRTFSERVPLMEIQWRDGDKPQLKNRKILHQVNNYGGARTRFTEYVNLISQMAGRIPAKGGGKKTIHSAADFIGMRPAQEPNAPDHPRWNIELTLPVGNSSYSSMQKVPLHSAVNLAKKWGVDASFTNDLLTMPPDALEMKLNDFNKNLFQAMTTFPPKVLLRSGYGLESDDLYGSYLPTQEIISQINEGFAKRSNAINKTIEARKDEHVDAVVEDPTNYTRYFDRRLAGMNAGKMSYYDILVNAGFGGDTTRMNNYLEKQGGNWHGMSPERMEQDSALFVGGDVKPGAMGTYSPTWQYNFPSVKKGVGGVFSSLVDFFKGQTWTTLLPGHIRVRGGYDYTDPEAVQKSWRDQYNAGESMYPMTIVHEAIHSLQDKQGRFQNNGIGGGLTNGDFGPETPVGFSEYFNKPTEREAWNETMKFELLRQGFDPQDVQEAKAILSGHQRNRYGRTFIMPNYWESWFKQLREYNDPLYLETLLKFVSKP